MTDAEGWPAVLHDPVAGVARRVRVRADPASSSLTVESDLGTRVLAAADLSVSGGGFGGEAVHLAWAEAGRSWALSFEGRHAEQLGAAMGGLLGQGIRSTAAAGASTARRAGRRTRTALVLFCLVPLAVLAGLWLLREPLLDLVLRRIPPSVDRQLGEVAFQQATKLGPGLAEGPAPEAVRAIGDRLLKTAPPHGFTFRFEVAREKSVNAFAAPGGFVVVHGGLIGAAATPEELAGVLAHEVTHVLRRHSMRQIVLETGFAATLSLFVSPEGAAGTLAGAAANLTSLRFGRDQEHEADMGGLDLLQRAKVSPDGLVSFFETLKKEGGASLPLLSTHPPSADRIAVLQAEIGKRGRWAAEPLAVDWPAVKAAVR